MKKHWVLGARWWPTKNNALYAEIENSVFATFCFRVLDCLIQGQDWTEMEVKNLRVGDANSSCNFVSKGRTFKIDFESGWNLIRHLIAGLSIPIKIEELFGICIKWRNYTRELFRKLVFCSRKDHQVFSTSHLEKFTRVAFDGNLLKLDILSHQMVLSTNEFCKTLL